MSKLIRVPLPIKVDRLTRIAQVRGTDVHVHWTVFLIAALMLSAVIRRPLLTIAGIAGWLGVMFIHECGHAFAAQRYGSVVNSIDIYPIFGLTCHQAPWSRYAECMIVWGGVLAQALIAIPVIAFLAVHGYTSLEPVNALLAPARTIQPDGHRLESSSRRQTGRRESLEAASRACWKQALFSLSHALAEKLIADG